MFEVEETAGGYRVVNRGAGAGIRGPDGREILYRSRERAEARAAELNGEP